MRCETDRRPLPCALILALSLLTGCFEGIPLVAAPDAGGLGRCADGQSGTFSVPGCFTPYTAPAAVRGVVHNPHADGLDPRQFVPGPPVVIDGVPIVPEPQYAIPAEPFITYAVGADGCRGACSTAVGIVDFAWSAEVLPALLNQGAYPRLALVDVGCGILPRPICDGAPQRYAQDYAALMDSAGYIRSALGYSPTARACREGICLAALGLQLADLCARANTWRWDADRDGAGDGCDNCVAAANPGQADRDGDGWGDQCDPCPADFSPLASQDADGDGHVDCADNCRDRPNPDQRDTDADGAGDRCDDDDDGDGLSDLEEDWVGTRRLDPDTDGDGQPDGADVCPLVADVAQRDTDGDGAGNACDADDDDDGLSDEAEAEAGTDPLDRDTDGDGHEDGADNCPLDENPGQEDADEDGPGDACDVCAAVADPQQADVDDDGIGDACCGEEDPDADGVPNCWLYPEAHPNFGQTGALSGWDDEWPGRVSCEDGVRRCRAAMEAPPLTRDALDRFFEQALGDELARPASWPPGQDWPPYSVLSAEQYALQQCYAEFGRRQASALPFDPYAGGPMDPAVLDWEPPEFTEADYAACIEEQLAAMQPVAVRPGAPARFGVGLVFEKVLYLTLFAPLNAHDDVRCATNQWFRKQVVAPTPRGGAPKRRTVEADIYCSYMDDGFVQWVEAKAWKTHAYLRPSRRVSLNDQLRRQWKYLEQRVASQGKRFRWTWIWAWKPPRQARLIMDHRWAGRRDPMVFDHHPMRRYHLDRRDTRIEPKHGWYVWTEPTLGGSGILPPLLRAAREPILDDGPCSVCNLSDMGQPHWSPACDLSAVNLPEVLGDGEPGVQPLEYNRGSDLFVDLLACGLEK